MNSLFTNKNDKAATTATAKLTEGKSLNSRDENKERTPHRHIIWEYPFSACCCRSFSSLLITLESQKGKAIYPLLGSSRGG